MMRDDWCHQSVPREAEGWSFFGYIEEANGSVSPVWVQLELVEEFVGYGSDGEEVYAEVYR